MKRPILIATLGFITGIIWGLYFNIVSFIVIIVFSFLLKILLKNKNIRIIKVFINKNVLILFCIVFLIGNLYIKYLEKDYSKIYKNLNKCNCIGTIVSEKEEKDYTYIYKIRIKEINNNKVRNKNFYISVKKKTNYKLEYADEILFEGEYIKPEVQRNYKGFNYSMYLKSEGIYGTIRIDKEIKVLRKNNLNVITIMANKLRNQIINNANKIFPYNSKGVFLGILLGYDEYISDEIKQNFSDSSLSHLLAVSGAHVSYVVLGMFILFKYIKIPKKFNKIFSCILLIFYLYIINFTPSVTRAVIMSIISIIQVILYRKQDIATTISFSSLLILISNPYKILNIGFLLSYAGTVGIIVFSKKFEELKEKKIKIKLLKTMKSMCFVTISAQILILPITIYYFNTISATFIISNIIAGIIIGPITIIGLVIIIVSFINLRLTAVIAKIYNILLLVLLKSTQIIAKLPISKIYVITPSIISVIIYYLLIFTICITFIIKKSKRYYLNRKLDKLILKLKNIIKSNFIIIIIVVILFPVVFIIFNRIPRDLKVNFIDVGQGDSCMITTPSNKKILIDSGGSESYDVGKNILFPYLLDRKVTKVDYIIISHFDTDHCKGFEYVMNNINVKNVIISKQPEDSENYKEFLKIVKKRKINIIVVDNGDKIFIEKNLYIYILWPDSDNFVSENALNNNSIVCKVVYNNFSMLFTGDIEKIAEEQIIKLYENSNALKSTVLKVAHHGSKSSSIEEILEKIKPKIALIGVGESNKFGHPNDGVIERLNNIRNKNI